MAVGHSSVVRSTTTTLHYTADYSNSLDMHSSGRDGISLANNVLYYRIFNAMYLWTGKG